MTPQLQNPGVLECWSDFFQNKTKQTWNQEPGTNPPIPLVRNTLTLMS
jgi:hypothetical protein